MRIARRQASPGVGSLSASRPDARIPHQDAPTTIVWTHPMLDVIVVASVLALFALLGLLVKGVERL